MTCSLWVVWLLRTDAFLTVLFLCHLFFKVSLIVLCVCLCLWSVWSSQGCDWVLTVSSATSWMVWVLVSWWEGKPWPLPRWVRSCCRQKCSTHDRRSSSKRRRSELPLCVLSLCAGDVQIGLMDKKGQLEVEVIRARGLTSKPGSKSLPGGLDIARPAAEKLCHCWRGCWVNK